MLVPHRRANAVLDGFLWEVWLEMADMPMLSLCEW